MQTIFGILRKWSARCHADFVCEIAGRPQASRRAGGAWAKDIKSSLAKTKKEALAHCLPTNTTLSALGVVNLLKDHVWKLHGYPENFVTNRDSRFTSIFWKELQEQCDIKSHMSTAYHPQTDGQTERMNRILKDMLRHYVSPQQDDWDTHLAAAEFAINASRPAVNRFDWRPSFFL
eukprot:674918-Pelagomonas_calceolata.AAC.1